MSLSWPSALATVLLLVLLLSGIPASAIEFPGPLSLEPFGPVTCARPVDWSTGNYQYLALGAADGALHLVKFRPQLEDFVGVMRLYLGGELVWLEEWENPSGNYEGLVVATRNPDRVVFCSVLEAPPFLVTVHEVDLPEDPGPCAFVGAVSPGGQELMVAMPGRDQLALLQNNDDQWNLVQVVPAGDGVKDLAAVDLDLDGVRELVCAEPGALSGVLGIYRRMADGNYAREGSFDPGAHVKVMTSHDFAGDGQPELLVGYADQPQVQVFDLAGGVPLVQSTAQLSLVADGLDVCRLPDGTVGLLAAVLERGLVELQGWEENQWQPRERFYPGCLPEHLVVGEFNGEGYDDLVCVDGKQLISTVMFGTEVGDFWGRPALALNTEPGRAVLADFNQDGRQDLVVAALSSGPLSFFAGRPDGGLASTPVEHDQAIQIEALAAVEAGGSAGPELAQVEIYTGSLQILDFDPEMGFQVLAQQVIQPYPRKMLARDMDRDGHDDLVMVQAVQGNILVKYGDGQGSFAHDVAVEVTGGAEDICTLDLNGDGWLDVVVSDGSTWVYGFLNRGGREFELGTWVLAGTGCRDLATGDLDGDGDLDLVVANITGQSLSFLENRGTGVLERRIGAHALTEKPEGVVCTDLNQDGNPDVVVNYGSKGQLALIYGEEGFSFGYPVPIPAGLNISSLRTGDFNLDGYPDLLNLDYSLHLGLTMLNVDRALVAVEPGSLSAFCHDGELEARILPDRSGPWELAAGRPGHWQVLAAAGHASLGHLTRDENVWLLRVPLDELPAGALTLRLTMGQGEAAESLLLELDGDCLGGPDGLPVHLLAWDQEPWPNPFNPLVQSRVELQASAHVRAAVYDVSGRRVALLLDQTLDRGLHTLAWNGKAQDRAAPAGLYFLRIETPGAVLSRKVLLLK